jgi:X-X-X-Leu-X-X-Gly heptad repeat protein
MFDHLRLNTKLIGSITIVALLTGLLSWAGWDGLEAAQNQLKILFGQSQKQRLAATVNADFQLAISKAKNVAILKDDANKAKVSHHFSEAQAAMRELLPLASNPSEAKAFEGMSQALAAVEPRLQHLLATAGPGGRAEVLYAENLKDITEQFDAAVSSYVVALDEKVGAELAARIRRTEWTLFACFALVLAGLGVSLALSMGVSRSLGELVTALNEGVNQVSEGSAQVAGASQQLAEGASESASSLEETSSSMEELASMTRQNSDNAGRANKLMEETRSLVGRGNEAMHGTLRSMAEMNESAEKVSKILKTIEEIAFQTNLLALNAAVEAARAGEHGRGFAVVAEEVRNLASRSAAAARDTAALIEENARRASSGMQVSSEAGKNLQEIVESSSKVAALVGEIAAASQEQSRGINEINNAVSQMDRVTQRVTSNAEELSSASEEMNGQADALREMARRLLRLMEGSDASQAPKETSLRAATAAKTPAFKPRAARPQVPVTGNGHSKEGLAAARKAAEQGQALPLGLAELRAF